MNIEQWVGLAAAKEHEPRGLHLLRVESGMAYASDGHRAHWAPTYFADGYYDPRTLQPVPGAHTVDLVGHLQKHVWGTTIVQWEGGDLREGTLHYFPKDQLAQAQPIGNLFINDNHQVTGVGFSEGMFTIAACKGVEKPAQTPPAAEKPAEAPKVDPIKFLALEADTGRYVATMTKPDGHYMKPVEADQLPAGTVIHNVGMGRSTVYPSFDFETYSEAGFVINPETGKVHTAAKTGNKNGMR
ncbi:hypothetical protein [Vibrio phage VP16C]|nr:hypothetical protein [Vibrio phage VP16C]